MGPFILDGESENAIASSRWEDFPPLYHQEDLLPAFGIAESSRPLDVEHFSSPLDTECVNAGDLPLLPEYEDLTLLFDIGDTAAPFSSSSCVNNFAPGDSAARAILIGDSLNEIPALETRFFLALLMLQSIHRSSRVPSMRISHVATMSGTRMFGVTWALKSTLKIAALSKQSPRIRRVPLRILCGMVMVAPLD